MIDTDIEDMEAVVDMTIETISRMAEDTGNYINDRVPEDLEHCANSLAETVEVYGQLHLDVTKNKSMHLDSMDDLEKQLKLIEDEMSKVDEEIKSQQVVISGKKKKIKAYKKENLQLKKEKELLAKKTTELQVVQALTDSTILSNRRRNVYGLMGSKEEGTLKPFKISKKEDLPKFTYQLAKEVFENH